MARGIVRQQDRVAIWHEAAQWADEQGNKSDLTPEQNAPPAEVAEPPQGAQKPAPKSNKFTIPANGLKKVLSDGVDKINYEPHSHPGVKNFVDTHPGFAKTYFKPHYQDALKEHFGPETDGGGSSYEKLKYHMPQEHHDALHTHEQAPPPKSNKFTTPANGLKKLLDQPHTETTHVTDWLSKHPGFQKTYMSPKYTDALRGHLGDKAYNELQEHLKAAQGGAQDQQQPTEKKPTKKWVGEGPEPGTESDFHPALQELGDMLGTKWGQNWKNLSDEELKPTLQQWQKTFQGGQPEKSQAIQQVLDKHFPGGLAPEDDPWHTGEVDEESLANAVGHSGDQDEIDNIKAQQPQKSFGEAVNEMFADQNIKNSVDELNGKTSEQQKEMIQKTVNAKPQYWDKLNKLHNDFFGEDAYNPHAVKPELAKSMGEYHGTDPDEYTGWIDSLNNDELKSFKDNPSAAGYAFNDYMQDMSGGDDDENDYYNEDDDPEYDEEDDDSELDDDSDDSPTQFNPQAFHNDWKKAFPQHTYLDNNVGPVEAKDELSAMIDEPEEDALGDPRAYGEGEYEEHYDQWMAGKLKAQQLYDKYFPDDAGAQGGAGYDKAVQIAQGIQALDPKTFDDDWVKDWTDENADSPEKQKKILQNLIEGQWAPEETEGYKALLQKHFGEGEQQQERQPQSLGQKMQAINPAINAETFDKQSPEGQKDILQNVWAKDPTHGPAFQQLYDDHYGDVDEINNIKGQQGGLGEKLKGVLGDTMPPGVVNMWNNYSPEDQKHGLENMLKIHNNTGYGPAIQQIYDEAFGGGHQQAPVNQQQSLAQGIKAIFPNSKLPLDSMSEPELKQKLEGWLEHLKDTPGHADNVAKLKALYDQNFGEGDIQAIKSQMPDLQGMEKDLADAFGGTAAASWMTNPDKIPDYLNTVAMGGGEGGALAKQLQEKYYGQGDQQQSSGPQPFDAAKIGQEFNEIFNNNAGYYSNKIAEGSPALVEQMLMEKIRGWSNNTTHKGQETAVKLQQLYDKYFANDQGDSNEIKQHQGSGVATGSHTPSDMKANDGTFTPLALKYLEQAGWQKNHESNLAQDWSPDSWKHALDTGSTYPSGNYDKGWEQFKQENGGGEQQQSGQPPGLKSFIDHHSGPNQVLAPDDPEWLDYWNKLPPDEQQEFADKEQGQQSAKEIPQSHVNHAQILDAYGEPTEDFMQWFAKTNDYPWGEKPADDKALLSMLANPENPWTKGKVQEYLKDQNTSPSEQYTGAEPLSAEELTKGLDWGDKKNGYDPDAAFADWKKLYPKSNQFNHFADPESAKDYLQSKLNLWPVGDDQYNKIKSVLDKHLGGDDDQDEIDNIKQKMGDKPDLKSILQEEIFPPESQSHGALQTWMEKSPEKVKQDIETLAGGMSMSGFPLGDKDLIAKWQKVHDAMYGGQQQQGASDLMGTITKTFPSMAQGTKNKWLKMSPEDQKAMVVQHASGKGLSGGKMTMAITKKWKGIYDALYGDQVQQQSGQSIDPGQIGKEFNAIWDGTASYSADKITKATTPKQVGQFLQNSIKNNEGKPEAAEMQKLYDKYFGDGGSSTPQPPEWNPQTFAEQYKEILPGSSSSLANGSVDPQKAFTKLTDLISAHPDSDKTPGLQKMLDHWFPTGAPEVAPVPGQPAQKKAPLPAGSIHYKALMKSVMDKAPHGAFSEADLKKFRSKKFQDWFDAAPQGYQKTLGPNPGIVIDDFDAGNYSAPVGGGEWTGPGKNEYYDVMGYPKSKGNEKLPKHLQQNKPRGENVKFPQYEDEQETLPLPQGEHFAPHYGPLPIYRVMNLNLDHNADPSSAPSHLKSEKERKLWAQQQNSRLRHIDTILNGDSAVRDPDKDLSALKSWGKQYSLTDKEVNDVAGMLYGQQGDLFADEKWDHLKDFAKSKGIDPQEMHDLAAKLEVNPSAQSKGSYDHPELGKLILDYLENTKHRSSEGGSDSQGGLGWHWTRAVNKVYKGVPAAGIGKNEMKATTRNLPIALSGLWTGQGEGGGHGGAYEVEHQGEKEHNLRSHAPVHIRRLQIRAPGQENQGFGAWHDTIDHGPMSTWTPGRYEEGDEFSDSSYAPGERQGYKPSLAEELNKTIGGGHDAEIFDKLKPGHKADMLLGKIWKDNPDKRKKIEELYRDFFVGRPDLPTKPHERRASLDRVRQTPKEIEARIIELEASYS